MPITPATNSEEVIITLGADGSVQTEVKGVKGRSCYDVTRQLEAALGAVKSDEKTAEYGERAKEETSAVRHAHYRR